MRPTFDAKDEEIRQARIKLWQTIEGPRVEIAVFKDPPFPAYRGSFHIHQVQKLHDGSLGYRLIAIDGSNDFGLPARPASIHIVSAVSAPV